MKVNRPYHGHSAQGVTGRSASSIIMQRTGSNCATEEQVTYVKGYKKPFNPNTEAQQAQRLIFGVFARGGKALKDAVKKG